MDKNQLENRLLEIMSGLNSSQKEMDYLNELFDNNISQEDKIKLSKKINKIALNRGGLLKDYFRIKEELTKNS